MSALDDLDIPALEAWIGREEVMTDILTPALVARFGATFGDWVRTPEDGVAPGLHWCLAQPAVDHAGLGPDGHPKRGGFLPPVPFQNRMWAGGEVTFRAPLRAGDEVTRSSRIESLKPKEGRSGPLVFVAVRHLYSVAGETAIEERQDIVYRPATSSVTPKGAGGDGPASPESFTGDPVTLFRYSAMTFNGHRIHYDYPYVTETEGYAGLVVHGPIQGTLLINAAARAFGTTGLTVAYRGLAPLIAGQPVTLHREGARFWLEKTDGTVTFEARATSETDKGQA
ncbi:HTD2 family dehydratase [Roseivivax sp.]